LNKDLYSKIRTVGFYDSSGRRKATFLANPEWHAAARAKESGEPAIEPFESLLDIVLYIPTLLERWDLLEKSDNSPGESNTALELQRLLDDVEIRLLNWYAELQDESGYPLFWIEDIALSSGGGDRQDADGRFREIVVFSNARIGYALLLYWCASILLYDTMLRVHSQLQLASSLFENLPGRLSLNDPEPHGETCTTHTDDMPATYRVRELHDIERTADTFATRTLQASEALAFYKNKVQGLEIQSVMSPLWVSMQFFADRSPDKFHRCQAMFKWFSKHGFAMSAPLRRHSTRTFPKIGKRDC